MRIWHDLVRILQDVVNANSVFRFVVITLESCRYISIDDNYQGGGGGFYYPGLSLFLAQ